MANRILFIDTETGGLDPQENSLLSIGLVVWDDMHIKNELEIFINDGKLSVTNQALEINKINLEEHKFHSDDLQTAIQKLLNFLDENFTLGEKITLAGHNIGFDIGFLKVLFRNNNLHFHHYFSHRSIDTSSIIHFLFLSGKIETKVVSSDEAFEFFGISTTKRHSALDDAKATAQLFTQLINITK